MVIDNSFQLYLIYELIRHLRFETFQDKFLTQISLNDFRYCRARIRVRVYFTEGESLLSSVSNFPLVTRLR